MFRVKPRATLGLIFFTVLIHKSEEKNGKSSMVVRHIFPRGCAPGESLMTLGNSLGHIFPDNHCGLFTVLIQNSEKQWKVFSGCLKNLPSGTPSGHQTIPRGCAPRKSLMTLGNSLGQIFPENHCGLSTVYTTLSLALSTVHSSLSTQRCALRTVNSSPSTLFCALCTVAKLHSADWPV